MELSARSLILICWTVATWAFSFGLGSQLTSHWLQAQGQGDDVIGYSHAFYYFGMAAASFAVPVGMRHFGAIACVTAGMLLSGLTLAPFPWTEDEWTWYALRFLNGCAGALCVIPLETIVSAGATPELKTRYFAYYGVAITIGGALGFALAPQLGAASYAVAFAVAGAVPVFAVLFFTFGMRGIFLQTETSEARVALAWMANFLAYGTAWCQGFLEGGMVAFLQLYLVSRGFSDDIAGTLMGITTVGVILFQVPVSALADRYEKTPILLICYALVATCLLTIPEVSHLLSLAAILFVFGGCTGAMYPLGLSLLGDRVPVDGLARAYAWFLIVECVGSVAGAAVMGKARQLWGQSSMFYIGLTAVLLVLLLAVASYFVQRRRVV